jgi:hypothetical protein
MPPHSLLGPERMIAGTTQDSGTNLYQTKTILYAHVRGRSHLFSMYEIYSGWQRACLATLRRDDVTNHSRPSCTSTMKVTNDWSWQRCWSIEGSTSRLRGALDALELMVTERPDAVIRFRTLLPKPSAACWSCRQADDSINPLRLDRQRGAL